MSISAQAFVNATDLISMLHLAIPRETVASIMSASASNYAATNAVLQHQCEAHLWKDSCSGIACLNDDMLIESGGVHAQKRVEGISLMIIEVHGDIY